MLIKVLTPFLIVVASEAFSPSSFTGSATSVCSRAELTTELSCPPSVGFGRRGTNMSMPPFLKKLGLKKPEKPIFGDESSNDSNAILPKEEGIVSTTSEIKDDECVVEEELSDTQKLLKQVKEAGTAGVISYALWELAFWILSVPVCAFTYYETVGHWPDFTNPEDQAKIGTEVVAFVTLARFAVPVRIGLALFSVPFIQKNVVDKFKKEEEDNCTIEE